MQFAVKRRNKKGFTLAELLIVIAIIAILIAIAVPTFTSALEKSRKTVCMYNIAVVERSFVIKTLLEEKTTMADVLANDYAGGKGMCPSGGVYNAKVDPATKVTHIYCSIHGKIIYAFNFATDEQTVKTNLAMLLQGMNEFYDNALDNGYWLTSNNGAGSVVLNASTAFRDKNNKITTQKINDSLSQYFGDTSGVSRTTDSNYRVAVDGNNNVKSVSYKSGNYGYIIFDNGNMYRLDNSYFTSATPGYDGKNPILSVVLDESLIFIQDASKYKKLN